LAHLIYHTQFDHDLLAIENSISEQIYAPRTNRTAASSRSNVFDPYPLPDGLHDSVANLMTDTVKNQSYVNENNSGPCLHGLRFNGSANSGYNTQLPYLLLDVREFVEWKQCHIVGGKFW
jgi:hypothetical protein